MDLQQELDTFITTQHLFTKKDSLLVAVSGGCDSMVLAYLLVKLGYTISIAHCNFQLRDAESDRDEESVKTFCIKHNLSFFVHKIDANAFATEHKLSIQEAARVIRYNWFQSLINPVTEKPFTHILTAHHANDNIETVFMNFLKGTGIKGLSGIAPKNGKIIRPLLFANRIAIETYAKEQQIDYIEDSSNASSKYTRNFLRNEVIPLLQQKYPQLEQNISQSIHRFKTVEIIYNEAIANKRKKIVLQKGQELHIPILKLRTTVGWEALLYEIVKDFAFTTSQIPEIIALLDAENSKYVASTTHRIIKNRKWLIIAPLQTIGSGFIFIEKEDSIIHFDKHKLTIKLLEELPQIPTSPSIAAIDAKNIKFPLVLRKWKEGDYFYPLGMTKKKKLARFFIDNKLSKTEKENVWVLESEKKIIWVIGNRTDNRFKITDSTSAIILFQITPLYTI